jgi:hypothetical protein
MYVNLLIIQLEKRNIKSFHPYNLKLRNKRDIDANNTTILNLRNEIIDLQNITADDKALLANSNQLEINNLKDEVKMKGKLILSFEFKILVKQNVFFTRKIEIEKQAIAHDLYVRQSYIY